MSPGARYVYVPEDGPQPAGAATPAIGVEVQGATLLALADGGEFSPETLREAKRLMRALIAPHLGARPLATRELFRR